LSTQNKQNEKFVGEKTRDIVLSMGVLGGMGGRWVRLRLRPPELSRLIPVFCVLFCFYRIAYTGKMLLQSLFNSDFIASGVGGSMISFRPVPVPSGFPAGR
jgi:hypothetical protein